MYNFKFKNGKVPVAVIFLQDEIINKNLFWKYIKTFRFLGKLNPSEDSPHPLKHQRLKDHELHLLLFHHKVAPLKKGLD